MSVMREYYALWYPGRMRVWLYSSFFQIKTERTVPSLHAWGVRVRGGYVSN